MIIITINICAYIQIFRLVETTIFTLLSPPNKCFFHFIHYPFSRIKHSIVLYMYNKIFSKFCISKRFTVTLIRKITNFFNLKKKKKNTLIKHSVCNRKKSACVRAINRKLILIFVPTKEQFYI